MRVREYGAEKCIWDSEKAAGGWRKLHYKLHNVCSSPHVIRATKPGEYEMGDICGTYGREEKCIQSFCVENCKKETTW